MFEARLLEVARVAEEAEALDDPWEGLRTAMEHIAAKQVRDRGLFEAVATEVIGSPKLREARHRVMEPFARLLHRAQEAGAVRGDLEPQDVIFLVTAAGHAAPCRIDLPDVWKRYLGVILDGMRPEGASPLSPRAPSVRAPRRGPRGGGRPLGAALLRARARAAAAPARRNDHDRLDERLRSRGTYFPRGTGPAPTTSTKIGDGRGGDREDEQAPGEPDRVGRGSPGPRSGPCRRTRT